MNMKTKLKLINLLLKLKTNACYNKGTIIYNPKDKTKLCKFLVKNCKGMLTHKIVNAVYNKSIEALYSKYSLNNNINKWLYQYHTDGEFSNPLYSKFKNNIALINWLRQSNPKILKTYIKSLN